MGSRRAPWRPRAHERDVARRAPPTAGGGEGRQGAHGRGGAAVGRGGGDVRAARLAVGVSLLIAACSAQTLAPPDAAGDAGSPGGAGGSPSSGGFITGDVDGVTVRGETQAVSYWWNGLQDGWLAAEGSTAEWTWILIVRNLAG